MLLSKAIISGGNKEIFGIYIHVNGQNWNENAFWFLFNSSLIKFYF